MLGVAPESYIGIHRRVDGWLTSSELGAAVRPLWYAVVVCVGMLAMR